MTTTTDTTDTTGWQLAGSAADAYEAYLVPAIFMEASARLVAAAGVGAGQRVLDAACGTGVVARAAAAAVGPTGTVTGVDVNGDMLATARRAATEAGADIDFVEADIADLPFDPGAFDVSLCEEALQFVPDPLVALRELVRVTRPGGRVAGSTFRSLDQHPVYAMFAELLGRHVGPEAQVMMASPFGFGDGQRLRAVAGDAGLVEVELRIGVGSERFPSIEEFVRREAASSPLAGPLGALDEQRRGALVEDLTDALADHLDDAGLTFPNQTMVFTGRVP